jgi:drug/metabolite transporter (DMT)-like permease
MVQTSRAATIPAEGLPNRTLAAAAAVLGYATLIGYTDNYVRVVAAEAGLWQFHLVRTLMAAAVFFAVAPILGLELRPRNWRAVAGRSALHGGAMLIYFGCLAFLPVAQVAAGLFTAPIFVLLIARFVYGHPLGPARIAAASVGFLGVILAVTPGTDAPLGWASVAPIAAGALYAMGNLATREWCQGESAATMTLGFFVALGVAGLWALFSLRFFRSRRPRGRTGSCCAAGSGRARISSGGRRCRRWARCSPWGSWCAPTSWPRPAGWRFSNT